MSQPPTRLIAELVGVQRRDTVVAAALLTAHEAGEAAVPVLIGVIVDRAIARHDPTAMWGWLSVLLATFAVLSVTYRFGARRSRRVSLRATHILRGRVADKFLGARGQIPEQLPGTVLSIATSDSERAGRATSVVANGVSSVLTLIIVTVALLATSVVVGLVVAVLAPPALIVMHLFSTRLERRSGEQQENAARASAIATDLVDGLRVLKGIGGERAAIERYRDVSRVSLTATLRAARADALYAAAANIVTGAFLVAVTLVAARQATQGQISVGALIAIIGLAQLVLDPLADVAGIGATLARSRASAARVIGVLDAPPIPDGGTARLPDRVNGEVRLDRISIGSLDALTLSIPPGQMLGVVAPRATDAAALIDCLGRRRDPESGSLLLDGIDARTIDPDEIRRAIVVSDHESALFEGSVLDNIARPGRADAAVVEPAIRAAAVDEVLETLPEGAASPVGEHGRALSGGQRQRVALARALAADATVLVAHDPTTAVDSVTEALIADGMHSLRSGRTTVLISTSPSLLAACDRVVMVSGSVVADGTHATLRSRNDYREAVLS